MLDRSHLFLVKRGGKGSLSLEEAEGLVSGGASSRDLLPPTLGVSLSWCKGAESTAPGPISPLKGDVYVAGWSLSRGREMGRVLCKCPGNL